MSEHPSVPRIRSALDVYNSGDHDAMKAFLADDIVWHDGGNHEMSGDYRGTDALLGYFRDWALANDQDAVDAFWAYGDQAEEMEHSNATRMRQTVGAFMSGDMPGLLQGFADDVVWYAPGDTPVSGTFRGHYGIMRFFSGLNEASGGSIDVGVDDVLGGDRYVTIFLNITAERQDERLSVVVAQFASVDGQGRWDRCWFLPDKLAEWNRFFAGASSGQR